MIKSEVGAKVFPSKTLSNDDPGHMCVSFVTDGELAFRGFRFDVTDLPNDYQDPARYREFLFDNAVPGYVKDDVNYLSRYLRDPASVRCRIWEVANPSEAIRLQELVVPQRLGNYSFNPDDFPDCDNCVTWACRTIRQIAGEDAIKTPRQGRMKLILEELAHSE